MASTAPFLYLKNREADGNYACPTCAYTSTDFPQFIAHQRKHLLSGIKNKRAKKNPEDRKGLRSATKVPANNPVPPPPTQRKRLSSKSDSSGEKSGTKRRSIDRSDWVDEECFAKAAETGIAMCIPEPRLESSQLQGNPEHCFKCSKCSYILAYKNNKQSVRDLASEHVQRCSKMRLRLFQCSNCSYFGNRKNMKRHIKPGLTCGNATVQWLESALKQAVNDCFPYLSLRF